MTDSTPVTEQTELPMLGMTNDTTFFARVILEKYLKVECEEINYTDSFNSLYSVLEAIRDRSEELLDEYIEEQKTLGKKVIYPPEDLDDPLEEDTDESDDDESDGDGGDDQFVPPPLPEPYVSRARSTSEWASPPEWDTPSQGRCEQCGESCYFAHSLCKRCYYRSHPPRYH